jgi:hypothetical protein
MATQYEEQARSVNGPGEEIMAMYFSAIQTILATILEQRSIEVHTSTMQIDRLQSVN